MNGLNVILETAASDSVIAGLRSLGHEVRLAGPGQFGGSQAIIRLAKGYAAGSDSRKDGHAAGY
jgi:gamma-glutamyltranspeptidase/glutathione hydrolase